MSVMSVMKRARAVCLVTLLVLFVSLPYVALGEPGVPALSASEETLFKGEMAKGIKIQMKLKREGSNLHGTYLYELYGRDIELKGTISESGEFTLQEFVKGNNTGSFKGTFVSKERIEGRWFKPGSDKGRAFFVDAAGAARQVSAAKETAAVAVESPKAQTAPRPLPKEPVQAASQPVKPAPQSAPAPEAAKSAAAPAAKAQPEPAVGKPMPVVQELPLAQQESKTKTPAEPARPSPEPIAKAPEQATQAKQEQAAPVAPVATVQEASKPAEPADGGSQVQPQERQRGVAGRVIAAVSGRGLPPWVGLIFNLRVLAAFGGILLLGGGLAWLAIVAGGMAGFRDNSALFRKAYSHGLAFLPGVFLLALGVGAVLAVFVE